MADKIFVILSFVLFVKTIERALCVFKDLQKRFKEPYVLFLGLANKKFSGICLQNQCPKKPLSIFV